MQKYSITQAINLPGYKITDVFKETGEALYITVRPHKRKPFICGGCGQKHTGKINSRKKVLVEDLRIFDKRVFLRVEKRRMFCPQDNKLHVEKVDWLKLRARVTKRFAQQVSRLTAITTNQEAGWYFGLDDEKVYRIDKEILEEKFNQKLVPTIAAINLSVDEVSYKKYHRYLTNVIDIDEKVVIWNDKGRKTEILDKYYAGIGKNACENIESVALDGARTYISSTVKYAVNAMIVYDKFHIVSKLNWAIDMTRKQELKKARKNNNDELVDLANCKQRFILLKNKSNLTENQVGYLKRLCEINEPIYKAMLLKENFLKLYDCQSPEEAKDYLTLWCEQALSSTVETFKIMVHSCLGRMFSHNTMQHNEMSKKDVCTENLASVSLKTIVEPAIVAGESQYKQFSFLVGITWMLSLTSRLGLANYFIQANSFNLLTFRPKHERTKIIAQSFKDKLQYIVNWFKKKISSAISEGINNKIKRLKRMAYGYRDIEYFKLKIHQHCGLLNPRRYSP